MTLDAQLARIRALRDLKEQGLTFADCVGVFGVATENDPTAQAAWRQWYDEGQIEIDDFTVVSACDTGAYVMAWVWVWVESPGDET